MTCSFLLYYEYARKILYHFTNSRCSHFHVHYKLLLFTCFKFSKLSLLKTNYSLGNYSDFHSLSIFFLHVWHWRPSRIEHHQMVSLLEGPFCNVLGASSRHDWFGLVFIRCSNKELLHDWEQSTWLTKVCDRTNSGSMLWHLNEILRKDPCQTSFSMLKLSKS